MIGQGKVAVNILIISDPKRFSKENNKTNKAQDQHFGSGLVLWNSCTNILQKRTTFPPAAIETAFLCENRAKAIFEGTPALAVPSFYIWHEFAQEAGRCFCNVWTARSQYIF